MDDEQRLRFDIGFIIKRLVTWPARRRDMDDHIRDAIADEIINHLKRANWRFHRGPLTPAHSTPAPSTGGDIRAGRASPSSKRR